MSTTRRNIGDTAGISLTSVIERRPIWEGDLDFAFLVHPRHIGDILRAYPEYATLEVEEILHKSKCAPVHVISFLTLQIDDRQLHGELLSVPILAEEFQKNFSAIRGALDAAILYLKSRNTRIAGLGALLPSVTKYGQAIANKGVGITTGHAFTAVALAEHVRELEGLGIGNGRVAVVGAAGSTGWGAVEALQLTGNQRELLLIDLPIMQNALKQKVNGSSSITVSSELTDLKSAGIVLCATNAPRAIITEDCLAPNAVVVDDAQPENISIAVAKARPDVTVLKCLAYVPGLSCPFDFGLFPNGEHAKKQANTFTCLAETVMLAAAGHVGDFTVGRPTIEHLHRITELAKQLSFTIAPFHSFSGIGAVEIHSQSQRKLGSM